MAYALFVCLDVADLAAVSTLPLCPGGFAAIGRGVACGCAGCALLLLASEASFFVAIETAEFGFQAVGG